MAESKGAGQKNKYAYFAMYSSAIAFGVFFILFKILALPIAIFGLVFSIIGLRDYRRNKKIGGMGVSIASLIISILIIVLGLLT